MPKLIWSVVCYRGVIDEESKKISLLDIPEAINLPPEVADKFEADSADNAVHMPLQVNHVSWWQRTKPEKAEHFVVRHAIYSPERKRLATNDMAVDLETTLRARTLLRFAGIPLQGLGPHEFTVSVSTHGKRWRKVASIPFDVNRKEESD